MTRSRLETWIPSTSQGLHRSELHGAILFCRHPTPVTSSIYPPLLYRRNTNRPANVPSPATRIAQPTPAPRTVSGCLDIAPEPRPVSTLISIFRPHCCDCVALQSLDSSVAVTLHSPTAESTPPPLDLERSTPTPAPRHRSLHWEPVVLGDS